MVRKIRRRDKRKSQYMHTIQRVGERYGIRITNMDVDRMVHDIQSGKSTPIEKQTNAKTIHMIECQGVNIYVAYDPGRKSIRTALPREYIGGG